MTTSGNDDGDEGATDTLFPFASPRVTLLREQGGRNMDAGFLGVGAMGQPMAGKLLEGGHALTILDINEAAMRPLLDRQARRAGSPKELADRHAVVFVSLPTLDAFRSVVDGPISGGPVGARAGTLSVMVSGDPAAIETVRPLLSLWGPTLTIAGDRPGAAQVLKLTNNILCAVALAATSEAFVMGAKAGLDPEVMLQAINAGTGNNTATQSMFPRAVLNRGFNYGAALHILMKDIDLAMQQGEELGVPMWVCQATRLMFKHAIFADSENEDLTSIVRFVERGAGFEMPKSR